MNSVSRRQFLKSTGTISLTALFLNPFQNLLALSNRPTSPPSWIELVEYARWCPSVHNLQPHLLKIISETEAELFYDPSRLLPIGDPNSVFATVAMGVFIEHLSIAAAHHSYRVKIREVFQPIMISVTEPTKFATLQLVPGLKEEELSRDLFLKRRTSRLHYNGEPLKEETLLALKNESEKEDQEFFFSNDKTFIDYIIDLNQETLFDDLASKKNCAELDHLFRYTKEDAETKRDGLWAKCMGFSGSLMRSVFQHPEKWHKGLRQQLLATHYKSSFKGTHTICWLGAKFNNTHDWLRAGKTMARNWLLLTKQGASIQPFGSLITNPVAYQKINEKFTQPKQDKKIWLIFRAGYSHEPTRSFRLNTNQLIIN